MVDGQPANHAPSDFSALQRGDQPRNIIAAARRLPVIKLPHRHGDRLNPPSRRASGKTARTALALVAYGFNFNFAVPDFPAALKIQTPSRLAPSARHLCSTAHQNQIQPRRGGIFRSYGAGLVF
jgi:hypothetical protein